MAAVPDKHYAGDTLEFTVDVPAYPPSDGWTLKYRFIPRFTSPTQVPIEVIATGTADDQYEVLVGPDSTVTWVPGVYGWGRWVEKTGARQVLDDLYSMGSLEILLHPAFAAQGADNRSQAQRALDEARAALANASTRAAGAGTSGVPVEYRIADRMMKFDNAADAYAGLIKAVNHWQLEVNREFRRAAKAAGLPDPARFVTRVCRG